MFSNLSKGSVLYGLDNSGGGMKYFTATVEEAKPAFPIKLGQVIGTVMDITAIKDGKTLSFKQIPSNDAIADYGESSFLLADSKDSLINYVTAKLQASKNIVESYDKNKALVEQYEAILSEINPNVNSAEIKDLKRQISEMQNQFGEVLSLLKQKQTQTQNP